MVDISKWVPDHNDFSYGRSLMTIEDYSRVVQSNHTDNIHICALIYSVLSWRENFKSNKSQFDSFLIEDLDTSTKILKNFDKVENILKDYGFNDKKVRSIKSIAENWDSLDITQRMRSDKEKKHGNSIREDISSKMFGVGYKFASLFIRMSGYETIVPVDTWAIKYVESRGFVNRYENSGLLPKQYISYEKKISKYAKKFDVSPALFQATIYSTFSTWKKDSGILSK